jgi:hypothetical protein
MSRNSWEHFLGNHSQCDHGVSGKGPVIKARETTLIQAATDLLGETGPYFDFMVEGAIAQGNELFKSQKARFASKKYAWRDSWAGRTASTVLDFNNPYCYFFNLLQNLHRRVSDDHRLALATIFASSVKEHRHRAGTRRFEPKVIVAAKSPGNWVLFAHPRVPDIPRP